MSESFYTREQQAQDSAARNAWFLKVNGREMTYEDVIKSFGGRFAGLSLVEPWQRQGRTILRDE